MESSVFPIKYTYRTRTSCFQSRIFTHENSLFTWNIVIGAPLGHFICAMLLSMLCNLNEYPSLIDVILYIYIKRLRDLVLKLSYNFDTLLEAAIL